jgi:hypothetical protein
MITHCTFTSEWWLLRARFGHLLANRAYLRVW